MLQMTLSNCFSYIDKQIKSINTSRPRQNGHYVVDHIFKFTLWYENCIIIRISLAFVPRYPINKKTSDNELLSELMMTRFTHVYMRYRPQCVINERRLHVQCCNMHLIFSKTYGKMRSTSMSYLCVALFMTIFPWPYINIYFNRYLSPNKENWSRQVPSL